VVKGVLLDTGPLGVAIHPRPLPAFVDWIANLRSSDAALIVPEIAHYELRRELLRINQTTSVERLDSLIRATAYAPITTPVVLRAAELWAETRRSGRPLADPRALDGDVLLAATALLLSAAGNDVVIATTNARHFADLAPAAHWMDIRP